jgi:hypothetical protein
VASANTVYGDLLTTGWDNWSWSTTQNFANTSPVYAGTNSIAVAYNAAWGGLYLHNVGTTTTGYSFLHFAFYSTTTNPVLQALIYDYTGNPAGTVSLTSYVSGGTISANTWYAVDIPLSDLNASNITITGIVLQKDSTGSGWVGSRKEQIIAERVPKTLEGMDEPERTPARE